MLARIDEIPWAKYSHAYGKAADVPELLRGLLATSAPRRGEAIAQLAASICHQGTLFSATAPAIPFLIELVAAPRVKDKENILALLSDIATLDDYEPFLLEGMPRALPAGLPAAFKRSLVAVRAGAPTYAALLAAKEPAVRGRAAFLLAWLPDTAAEHAPLVRDALRVEKDQGVRAAYCIVLAFLARYLESDAHDALFESLLTDADAGVRTAAAIAIAHTKKGEVGPKVVAILGAAAAMKALLVEGLVWLRGDLALFATRVLAALPRTDEVDAHLVSAMEAAGPAASFAANVVVRRLFAARKEEASASKRAGTVLRADQEEDRALAAIAIPLGELDARQRRVLDAIGAAKAVLDGNLSKALAERGLPSTYALVTRYLAGSRPSAPSLLDREVSSNGAKSTLAELVVGAIEGEGGVRAAVFADILAATTPEERVDLAMTCVEQITVPWSAAVALELMWTAAPEADAALVRAVARSKKETAKAIPMIAVAAGVGLASAAIAKSRAAEPAVDAMLQQAYGFWPRVRDALAALPVERREQWVLDPRRDDRAQPAEYFSGAWRYWVAVPTTKIADRALAHVATWKPKDPWGGRRKTIADPMLAAFIVALRAAGNDADAARCAAALAALR
jgi:hypothetical protein